MPTKKELEERVAELEYKLKIEQEKNELECPYCGCKSVPAYGSYVYNMKSHYKRECKKCLRIFETDINNKVIIK